jgi:hypothetical protein
MFPCPVKFPGSGRGGLKGGCEVAQEKKTVRAPAESVRGGYEKLAYGGVNDAVRLLFEEEPDPEELRKMDLFSVAEIRRVKGGGTEIKFYDRMKALECLRALEERGSEQLPLYRALSRCAKGLGEEPEDGV